MNLSLKSFKEFQFVPASKNFEAKKLIFCLHGRGDTLLGIRKLKHRLKLKEWSFLFVNAPDPWTTDTGFQGFSWYGRYPKHREGIERSLKLLNLALMELEMQGFSREHTVLFGFSQGCVMSLELALRSTRPFFGVLGVSGTVFDTQLLIDQLKEQAMRTPILMVHGTKDELLDFDRVESKARELQRFLPHFEFLALDKGHSLTEEDYPILKEAILKWEQDFH